MPFPWRVSLWASCFRRPSAAYQGLYARMRTPYHASMVHLIWLLLAGSAVFWLVIAVRLRFLEDTIPSLDSDTTLPEPPGGWPFISVIVPARNEEKEVGKCLASLAHQDYPRFEIIFVNDQSTDDTGRVAREALKDCSFATVIDGAPRPEGQQWCGKNWALVQGLEYAKADWLLFIDSDVVHHPATFKKAMAKAAELQVDVMSILPTIDCRSFWEKCVMPLFAQLSVLIEPLDSANQLKKKGSRICGAFVLIKRSVYLDVGGHEAVREQILEDMALAQLLKKKGHRIWLTYTRDLTNTRMYDSFRDLWTGLGRLSFPMLRYSIALLLVAHLAAIVGALTPVLALAGGLLLALLGHGAGIPLLAAGAALSLLLRWGQQPIFSVVKVPSSYAWLLPLASYLYVLAATHAAWRHLTKRGLPWKQRVYGK